MIDPNSFLEYNDFLVKPFYQVSEIVIEKETDGRIFKDLFNVLFEYFRERKEYRTTANVDRVLKQIYDFISKNYPEKRFFTEEEKEDQSREFIESFENYIDKYENEINEIFEDPKFEPFLTHWLLNIDMCLQIFDESFEQFKVKKRKLIRSCKTTVEKLFDNILELAKAIFLVLYRIVEQFYMIINKIPFVVQDEIDYLLNDIVYLENVQRSVNSAFN